MVRIAIFLDIISFLFLQNVRITAYHILEKKEKIAKQEEREKGKRRDGLECQQTRGARIRIQHVSYSEKA